jgi:hypothetical protein
MLPRLLGISWRRERAQTSKIMGLGEGYVGKHK